MLLLAALLALALAIAPRAEAYVYWIEEHGDPGTIGEATIGRANLDGSDVKHDFIVLPLGGAVGGLGGLAVDDAHLYWVNPAAGEPVPSIGRANLDGTAPDHSFIADLNGSPLGGVAVDDEHVYWVSVTASDIAGGTGGIARANLDGTGVDESFITDLDFPAGGLAVDGSHLYWINTDPREINALYGIPDRIGRANLDGTGVDEGFIGASDLQGVAVDDPHLWWAFSGRFSGGIERANLDGTGVETVSFFTEEELSPCGVAVTDTHLYWKTGGSIGRANLDGSRPRHELITGAGVGCGLAVDALGPPPSNDFSFGKVKENKRKGTAKLTVTVPGPGELDLAKTKRVRPDDEPAEVKGKEKLSIKPKGKARRKLNENGKATVKAKVTYTPDGGEPNTESKKIKLVKRG
jgi:hypothetical protein